MLAAEVLFPSSPNWYLANVADASAGGTVVFAANQAIALVDAKTRQVRGICNLRGRATGVALGDRHVVACTAERHVHAFELHALGLTASHREHAAEPTAVIVTAGFCVTGDKRGNLCLWSLPAGPGASKTHGRACVKLSPRREALTCLSAAPPPCARFAAGYSSGFVGVIDVDSQRVVHSLNLQSTVQGLSWAGAAGAFLASSCQDQSVQLWHLGDPLSVQHAEPELRQKIADACGRHDGSESRSWISVHAISEEAVVYSGPRGELFAWDAVKKKPLRAAPQHTRPIFSIRPVGNDHILTAGMDRFVVLWTLGKGAPQMKWRLCCLGGHATAIRTNGTNMACIGCGDNSIRVMDLLHREHRQHCWVVWRGLRSAITSLSSIPNCDVWGFGLQDGGFGYVRIDGADGPGDIEMLASKTHPGPVTSICFLCAPSFKLERQHALPAQESSAQASQDGAIVDEPESSAGNADKQKGKGKRPRVEEKTSGKEARPLPKGLFVVTLSAGQKVLVTPLGTSGGKTLQTAPLKLAALPDDAQSAPMAMSSWPRSGDAGDAVVVAAAHKKVGGGSEATAFHVYSFVGDEPDGPSLEAVLLAQGLEGGVASMAVRPRPAGEERSCHVLCGTSTGSVVVLRMCLPSRPTTRDQEDTLAACPVDASSANAHSKSIVDVQWNGLTTPSEEARFLSASLDGNLKVWVFRSQQRQLQCLHTCAGLVHQSPSGALLSACWDVSSGGADAAVLCGGRDQIAFRWTPGAEELQPRLSPGESATDGTAKVRPAVEKTMPSRAAAASSVARAPRQRTKQGASLLSLASQALHQQSASARASELVRVAPVALELWLGACGERAGQAADAGSPSLTGAIFQNSQSKADFWLEAELQQKLGEASEDRSVAYHRARLLKLWATSVQEAAALEQGEDAAAATAIGAGASTSWFWAALRLASRQEDSESEAVLEGLMAEGTPSGASMDSVHHACAAALTLGRVSDAVRLYLRAELVADALLVARLRLPAKHPLIAEIYEQWGADLKRKGRYDQASACRLATGHLELALADLEEWLVLPRGSSVGSDPLRFAGAFAAAGIAEALASKHLGASQHSESCGDDDDRYAVMAYDHRHWWGQQVLRTAVVSWKRCIIEALHAGSASHALQIARVGIQGRKLSVGEAFLRGTLSGYASAVAWWAQLDEFSADAAHALCRALGLGQACEAEEPDAASEPLLRFLSGGQSKVAPEEDWDFEWRALTWLPAFDRSEDPVLSAAVELGRACASLASGATRASVVNDAPWEHVTTAISMLLGAGESESFAAPLCCLGALALRPSSELAVRARSASLATTAYLAGELRRKGGPHGLRSWDPWQLLSIALFGITSTGHKHHAASEALRRGHRLLTLARPGGCPRSVLACAAADARAGLLPNLALDDVLEDVGRVLRSAAESCGLQLDDDKSEEDASDPRANMEEEFSKQVLRRVRKVHAQCISPLLVPLTLASWCIGLRATSRAPMESTPRCVAEEHAEYVVDMSSAEAAPSISNSALWASLIGDLSEFVAEAEAEAEAETSWESAESPEVAASLKLADDVEVLQAVSELESDENLAWLARLALLHRRFDGSDRSTEEGRVRFVCTLFSSLAMFAGSCASPATADVDALAASLPAAVSISAETSGSTY